MQRGEQREEFEGTRREQRPRGEQRGADDKPEQAEERRSSEEQRTGRHTCGEDRNTENALTAISRV